MPNTPDRPKTPDGRTDKLPGFWSYAWSRIQRGEWSWKDGLGTLREDYQALVQKRQAVQSLYENYETIIDAGREGLDYYILLITSCLIAMFGLFQNSAAVIIGAMIVAPLMGPIMGLSAAVLWGRMGDLGTVLWTLLKSSLIVLAITSGVAWLLPDVAFNDQLVARTSPGLFDIGVAVASGLVGAYGSINRRVSATLSGVAIAVALMPPLCTVGIALGRGLFAFAWGAFLLFSINILGISLASLFVFWVFGLHPLPQEEKDGQKKLVRRALSQVAVSLVALALIVVPMVGLSQRAIGREDRRQRAERLVRTAFPAHQLGELSWVDERETRMRLLVFGEPPRETLSRLREELAGLEPEGVSLSVYALPEWTPPPESGAAP